MAYALVTGAANGIGRSIAFELARRGYHLILVDINDDGLTHASEAIFKKYGVDIQLLHLDLSATGAIEQVLKFIVPYESKLNVVVNNAGYGLNGAFENLTLDEQLNIIDVNIKAVVKLSYGVIPVLKKFRKAHLLNVGSTTSYQTVPYLNIYASTKAFVLSFTRGLRYELRNTNVYVSCLSPGSTDTDFVKRARMGPHILKTADKFNMHPDRVAKIAIKGMLNGKAEIIPGFTNKLNAYLPKFFPKAFVERIAGNIYEPKPFTS